MGKGACGKTCACAEMCAAKDEKETRWVGRKWERKPGEIAPCVCARGRAACARVVCGQCARGLVGRSRADERPGRSIARAVCACDLHRGSLPAQRASRVPAAVRVLLCGRRTVDM
jgi:hypothetical protein